MPACYDLRPRAREVVWIMLAQRAARGLASLYAHDNQFDLKQAKAFQVEWTPRGWMRPDLDLLGFEQQLYLRQPAYGTSYVTGKYLLEDLMRVRSHQLGKDFSMKRYFDEVNGAGMIPVTLIQWQLTGSRPQCRKLALLAAFAFRDHGAAPVRRCTTRCSMPGKTSGAQTTVIGDDGRINVTFSYRDNGRGPDLAEKIRVAADGTIQSYRLNGKVHVRRGAR